MPNDNNENENACHMQTTTTTTHCFRHGLWFAQVAFSVMALCAVTSRFMDDVDIQDQEKHVKWTVSALSVVLSLSSLSTIAHVVSQDVFVGSVMEGGMSVVTTGMWAAVMPAIMDPTNMLAVHSRYGGIHNPILYFFSWLAFMASYFGLMAWCFKYHDDWKRERDENARTSGPSFEGSSSLMVWSGLVLTSFVVLVTCCQMFKDGNCGDDKDGVDMMGALLDPVLPSSVEDICDRLQFGISLGSVSALMAVVWPVCHVMQASNKENSTRDYRMRMLHFMDTAAVLVLFVLWTFGAVWLTFNENKSPGHALGNLFFFTWGGWVICLYMFMKSMHYTMINMCPTSDTTTSSGAAGAGGATLSEAIGDLKKGSNMDVDSLEPVQEMDAMTHDTHDDKHEPA